MGLSFCSSVCRRRWGPTRALASSASDFVGDELSCIVLPCAPALRTFDGITGNTHDTVLLAYGTRSYAGDDSAFLGLVCSIASTVSTGLLLAMSSSHKSVHVIPPVLLACTKGSDLSEAGYNREVKSRVYMVNG